MFQESRTEKSIRNAKVALLFYFINLILQFFSRKIFLDHLGAEILGLNTTAQNLLSFLNLAELGIGTAISYTLYKPLFQKDTETINEIVSVQGWLYRRIAYVVIAGSCLLMCFFPLIFRKAELPLWYTYGSFVVLLTSSLLGYFVNYRQIVLTADQKEYKITFNVQGVKIIKIILQILAIRYLHNGYVYWLAIEFLMAFVTSVFLNRTLKREYAWLKSDSSAGRILRKKYPGIIVKTKQIFFHRIAGFTLSQTSPLIIYSYTSLTLVAVYGNYMLIIAGINLLMNALLSSVGAGIGNLVAEGNKTAIKRFFWELTSCRIWLAAIFCFGIYRLAHPFIALWIGKEYFIEQPAFVVLILITFITFSRTNDAFLSAFGLFQDVGAPVAETVLNIGLSVVLGYYYGLAGILSGVLISLLVIVCCWKPYFLYKYGFKEGISEYVVQQLKYFLLLGGSLSLSEFILNRFFHPYQMTGYMEWGQYALAVTGVFATISLLLFYIMDQGMRDLLKRIKRILYR